MKRNPQWSLVLIVFIAFSFFGKGQSLDNQIFKSLSYDSLVSILNSNREDTILSKRVAYIYLEKARKNNDSTKMARAHERLAAFFPFERAIFHIDSCIYLSRNSTHKNYPTVGYAFKSYYLYRENHYEESLNYAILQYHSAIEKNNLTYQIGALNKIARNNSLWGDHSAALKAEFAILKLLEENDSNELKFHPGLYYRTLSGVGSIYGRLRLLDSALYFYKKAIPLALHKKDTIEYFDLVERSGGILYFMGDFQAARDSLTKGYNGNLEELPHLTYPYYMGSMLYQEGKKVEGVAYFRKIDSSYQETKELFPELASTYNKLANYHKELGNLKEQLDYTNKLLGVDSLMAKKNKYLKEVLTKEYKIPVLLSQKELLIRELRIKNKSSSTKIWFALCIIIICMIMLGYYFRKQQAYENNFQRLLEGQSGKKEAVRFKDNQKARSGVPTAITTEILTSLQQFESNNLFLDSGITLQNLAKKINTNANYLSKVVNAHKGKSFSRYISSLRVEYATNWLQKNPIIRNYTIRAIALDCGFKSQESFSKAFRRKHGIYPSYFIKQLENRS